MLRIIQLSSFPKATRLKPIWLFGALSITLFLIIFEPFGTSFRHGSAVLLAISYSILSMATLFILENTLKNHLFRKGRRIHSGILYTIWYLILLTIISLINFFYFGLWACHCETEYKLTLLTTQFLPRTLAVGGFVILIARILEVSPKTHTPSYFFSRNDKNENILSVSSFGNYLRIKRIFDGEVQETIERGVLSNLIKKSPPYLIRCHRSHVVNIQHINKIIKENRRYVALLNHGLKIPVSASRLKELNEKIDA